MNPMTTTDGPFWKLLRYGPWAGAAALLLLPLVAMQYTDEVQWTAFDFVIAGVMFLSVLIPWELANRASSSVAYRVGAGVTLGASFLIIWVGLAVGIVGSEDNAANLMFFGVLGVMVILGVVGGFRAQALFRATLAAAALQVAAGAVALIGNLGADGPGWPMDVVGATGFFTLAWLFAAGLFRRAQLDARTA